MTREAASIRIPKFGASTAKGAFKHLNRNTVAAELLERQKNAWKINQNASSLCGPASLNYILCRDDFDTYAHYIMDLYETGEGSLGTLKVKPGSDCKAYKVPPAKISQTDWIGLASLRDSENSVYDYQSVEDEFAGITLGGALKKWFEATGRSPVQDCSSTTATGKLHHLIAADACKRAGMDVVLFIHADILGTTPKKKWSASFPNHWVVMTSTLSIGGWPASHYSKRGKEVNDDEKLHEEKVSLDVYTWGNGAWTIKGETVNTFLNHYFGCVIVPRKT